MAQHIGALTLLVADYDEAIAFFTRGMGFELLEDTPSTSRANRANAGCGSLPRGLPAPPCCWLARPTRSSGPPSVARGAVGSSVP